MCTFACISYNSKVLGISCVWHGSCVCMLLWCMAAGYGGAVNLLIGGPFDKKVHNAAVLVEGCTFVGNTAGKNIPRQ